jgi:hypothetical protein
MSSASSRVASDPTRPGLLSAPIVMLFGNYAGMTAELTAHVGAERVIGGFPWVGGRIDGDTVAYSLIKQQPTIVAKIGSSSDLDSLTDLIERIRAFGERYSALGKPFSWTFTRQDLERRLHDPLLHLESAPSLHTAA